MLELYNKVVSKCNRASDVQEAINSYQSRYVNTPTLLPPPPLTYPSLSLPSLSPTPPGPSPPSHIFHSTYSPIKIKVLLSHYHVTRIIYVKTCFPYEI